MSDKKPLELRLDGELLDRALALVQMCDELETKSAGLLQRTNKLLEEIAQIQRENEELWGPFDEARQKLFVDAAQELGFEPEFTFLDTTGASRMEVYIRSELPPLDRGQELAVVDAPTNQTIH